MRFVRLLLCILFSLPAAVLFPVAAHASTADGGGAILIVGDSLSAAYGMEIGDAWPSLLQQRLHENGHAYRVFNSSITGETTQGGVTRLPRLLQRHQPEIVVIELGGNDGLRGLPIEVTRSNLAQMIELSRQAGARVILAEMRIPPNYGLTYTEKFNGTYTELATRYDVALLPFLLNEIALDPGLMLDDGVHPTAAAQPLILEQVWTLLEPLL